VNSSLLIVTSGGTTNVVNAAIAGAIKAAQEASNIDRILAGCPGICGVLAESLVELTDLTKIDLERLYFTPASGFVGTSRTRPMNNEALTRLSQVLAAHNVGFFINIGGNGTIKQSVRISQKLSGGVKIAAVAKTVDNDLGDAEFEKVLYTPGFPSCANYWRHKVLIMNQENSGAYSHDKVLIAQTFGRRTGFLAGCARLGDVRRQMPLVILLPEDQRPLCEVLECIKRTVAEEGRAIVILSEGYDLGDIGRRYDPSGQVMYGTSRTTAAQLLVNHCFDMGIQARGFVPGFDQRSDISFVSALDLQRSCRLGREAVERLTSGENDFLASISKSSASADGIEFAAVKFSEIDDYSRALPDRWISRGHFDVTDEYLEYVEPLIGDRAVDLHALPARTVFICPRRANVEKKLRPYSIGLNDEKASERLGQAAERPVIYARSFEV